MADAGAGRQTPATTAAVRLRGGFRIDDDQDLLEYQRLFDEALAEAAAPYREALDEIASILADAYPAMPHHEALNIINRARSAVQGADHD